MQLDTNIGNERLKTKIIFLSKSNLEEDDMVLNYMSYSKIVENTAMLLKGKYCKHFGDTLL